MKIINGLCFGSDRKMTKRDLCFENGVITDTSVDGVFDAEGCYVLPGFIDTHIHGSNGVEFYFSNGEGSVKSALDWLCEQGVTSCLMTLATEQDEDYRLDCERYVRENDDRLIGIHCEGPFMNYARRGGLTAENLQEPNVELLERINGYCGGALKIVSLAPEVPGATEVIKHLCEVGIKVSMAHTDASFEEAADGVEAGISRVTHLYNAMRPFSHRDPSAVGCALTDDRLNCELICDLHHVSAPAIKLAVRSKGVDNITMISDSSFFAGMQEGVHRYAGREYIVKDGFARLPNGTICGSACSLAVGAKNMFSLGFSPEEIAVMACVNPAKAAGCTDRGELKTGLRADIIVLDSEFNVTAVFVKGKRIR